jgi:hypothetical protein
VIDGLNHILDLSVREYRVAGRHVDHPGTRTAVGHRRRASYRNMLVMIRDRDRGPEEEGDDARSGQGGAPDARLRRAVRLDDGTWTTDMFIEAVYKTLPAKS